MGEPALSVQNLTIAYGVHVAVRDVSFHILPGEVVALVGRSGAGKSSVIAAIMDLLPPNTESSGVVAIAGKTRSDVSAQQWRNRQVGLVPQNPFSWFNPMVRMRKQLAEVVRADSSIGRAQARVRVRELLQTVGLAEPERVEKSRPEGLSGGMRQRVAIAAAIAHNPPLLLADEPTSALDPDSQSQILELLGACRASGQAVLLVSHDESVVERLADRILYIEAGELFDPGNRPVSILPERAPVVDGEEVLSVRNLSAGYPSRVVAKDFSLQVKAGEAVALVGESGSGKSTLCGVFAGLRSPVSGQVSIKGTAVQSLDRFARARAVQVVFQDVRGSLDGRLTAQRCVELPLRSGGLPAGEIASRVQWAFEIAGVDTSLRHRSSGQLSGGEAQRVALARALAMRPALLLLDEPFSALDIQTRDALLQRLVAVQAEFGMAIVAVLHNEDVVRGFAHRVVVLKTVNS